MHCIREKTIKDGYILLCTLFVGILCITVAMCCFTYEMAVKKNNKYFNTTPEISIKRQEYKEHLFTYLNCYVNENIEMPSKDIIRAYFIQNEHKVKFEYEKSYMVYDEKSDCFVEIYAREEQGLEKDYYSYEVENNKIVLSYLYSEYVKGKL